MFTWGPHSLYVLPALTLEGVRITQRQAWLYAICERATRQSKGSSLIDVRIGIACV